MWRPRRTRLRPSSTGTSGRWTASNPTSGDISEHSRRQVSVASIPVLCRGECAPDRGFVCVGTVRLAGVAVVEEKTVVEVLCDQTERLGSLMPDGGRLCAGDGRAQSQAAQFLPAFEVGEVGD